MFAEEDLSPLVSSSNAAIRHAFKDLDQEIETNGRAQQDVAIYLATRHRSDSQQLQQFRSNLNEQFLVTWSQMALTLLSKLQPSIRLKDILSAKGLQRVREEMQYVNIWSYNSWPAQKFNMLRALLSKDLANEEKPFKFDCLGDSSYEGSVELTFDMYRKIVAEVVHLQDSFKQNTTRNLGKMNAKSSVLLLLSMYATHFEQYVPLFVELWSSKQIVIQLTEEQGIFQLTCPETLLMSFVLQCQSCSCCKRRLGRSKKSTQFAPFSLIIFQIFVIKLITFDDIR
jgi:hypothetical protein